MSQPTQGPEIDLLSLFQSIGSWIKGLFYAILLLIAKLRQTFIQQKIFFGVLILIGVGIVLYLKVSQKGNKYTSSMIFKCDYITMKVMNSTMDKLNLLCQEPDREGLREILDLDESAAKNILEFEAIQYVSAEDRTETEVLKEQLNNVVGDKKALAEKVIKKIELGNLQTFQINIDVKNPDVVQKLDSAIIKYFRNSPYISKRIKTNRINLTDRRNKLQNESNKLDSLKAVLYENFSSRAHQTKEALNNVIISDKYLFDPVSLFQEDLSIHSEMQLIDKDLQLNSDFEIIEGLTTYRTPSSYSLGTRLILAFLITTCIGYLLLGFWNFNKYLASLTKQD